MKQLGIAVLILLLIGVCLGLTLHDGDVFHYTVTLHDGHDSGTDVWANIYAPGDYPTAIETTIVMTRVTGDSVWYLNWIVPASAEHGMWLLQGKYVIDGDTNNFDSMYEFQIFNDFDPAAESVYVKNIELDAADYDSIATRIYQGGGDHPVNLYVKKSADSTALSTAQVYWYSDAAYTDVEAFWFTSSAGLASFMLDNGTAYLVVAYQGWRTDSTITVADTSALQTFTIYLDVTPPTPSNPSECVVYGTAWGPNATKVTAIITAELQSSGSPWIAGGIPVPKTVADTSDAVTGAFQLPLFWTSAIRDNKGTGNTKYKITWTGTGVTSTFQNVTIPDSTSISWYALLELNR